MGVLTGKSPEEPFVTLVSINITNILMDSKIVNPSYSRWKLVSTLSLPWVGWYPRSPYFLGDHRPLVRQGPPSTQNCLLIAPGRCGKVVDRSRITRQSRVVRKRRRLIMASQVAVSSEIGQLRCCHITRAPVALDNNLMRVLSLSDLHSLTRRCSIKW